MTLDTVHFFEMSQQINAQFEPLEDITAFELAKIIPFFHGKVMTEAEWTGLGEMRRHFIRLA